MSSDMERANEGHPQEIGVAHVPASELPDMEIWCSRRIQWFAAAKGTFPDTFEMRIYSDLVADRVVCYRKLTAEYLTWLRSNWDKGLDPRSTQQVQARLAMFGQGVTYYMPELSGVSVDISGYKGPPIDPVSYARS